MRLASPRASDDGHDELLAFLSTHRVAVRTSVSPERRPQAALVAYVMGDGLEILFDTLPASRKLANLRSNPAVAFVIGGWTPDGRRTVRYEGVADEPGEPDLTRFKEPRTIRPGNRRPTATGYSSVR